MRVNVQVKSEQLTKDDLRLLLQAIRDCEQKNFKDKEIFIGAEAPDLTTDEMGGILKSIVPPFTYGPVIFKYKPEGERRGVMNAFETWKCHICGEERPDAKISVLSKPLVIKGQVCGQQNIRYCNDQQRCIDGAKNFSFFKESIAGGTTD